MAYELYNRQRGIDALYINQHVHDDKIEIVQVLHGTGRILVGDNFCSFRPGDVFVIDSGVIHCTSPDAPADYVRNKLLFDRSILAELTEEVPLSLSAYFSLPEANPISARFDRLTQMKEAGASGLQICAELLLLLNDCLSCKSERFIPDNSISARTIAYINQNLLSDLSLDALATNMHISKFHLCRIFKAETAMTLGGYIQTARLNHAKKRLLFSDDSVARIAAQIGFNDSAAFSKAFTLRTGCSPIAYRKNGRAAK